MGLFVVDVEADGRVPGLYSMVCFGAVYVDRALDKGFSAKTAPIPGARWVPDALAVSGFGRAEHEAFPEAKIAMVDFAKWIESVNGSGKASFVSDNPAFDWQFINYYFELFEIENPFGHSARRIGDFCAGLERRWNASSNFKRLRKTRHTHDPFDDAKGNAEALIALADKHKVALPGVAPKQP